MRSWTCTSWFLYNVIFISDFLCSCNPFFHLSSSLKYVTCNLNKCPKYIHYCYSRHHWSYQSQLKVLRIYFNSWRRQNHITIIKNSFLTFKLFILQHPLPSNHFQDLSVKLLALWSGGWSNYNHLVKHEEIILSQQENLSNVVIPPQFSLSGSVEYFLSTESRLLDPHPLLQ